MKAVISLFTALAALVFISGCATTGGRGTEEYRQPPSQEFPERVLEEDEAGAAQAGAQRGERPRRETQMGQRGMEGTSPYSSYETENLMIERRFVSGTVAGEDFVYEVRVQAKDDLADVTITEELPQDVQFVSASMQPQVEGDTLRWVIDRMNAGETRTIRVTVQPQTEGEFTICSYVTANPLMCSTFVAGLPQLNITKTGPDIVDVGEQFEWQVAVTNTGTAPAENVTFTDNMPQGVTSNAQLRRNLGTIEPGETVDFTVPARATAPGSYTNVAQAIRAGAEQPVEARDTVRAVQASISIAKSGPEEEYVFKTASYTIQVTNTGDTDLQNVTVQDEVPEFMTIVEAGGGRVDDRVITWQIPNLRSGQSRSFNIRLSSPRPVVTTNVAMVETERGLSDQAQARTNWIAVPGVTLSIVDTEDPVQIGETTTLVGQVRHQSDFQIIDGRIEVTVGRTLEPLEVAGIPGARIEGNRVIFPEVTLNPGEQIDFEIVVRSRTRGVSRSILVFSADFLDEPAISEEPTNSF